MIKIFIEDFHWRGKLLVFTWHFKEELEKLGKPIEFVLDVLEKGEHVLVAKKQRKYNVYYHFQKKYICMSYAEHENIILIHIKKTTRKK